MDFIGDLPQNDGVFTVYVDNWYGSESLAHYLNSMGVKFVLCCKGNRPTYLFNGGLTSFLSQKGDVKARYKEMKDESGNILPPLVVMSFFDRKKCNFISNIYGPEITPLSKDKQRPELIYFYNYGMGGVDNFDYGLHSYPLFPHRRSKFTRVVFFGLLKMLIVNLWYCYRFSNPNLQNTTQSEFLMKILEGCVDQLNLKRNDEEFASRFCHFSRKMAENEKRLHCVVCRGNTAYKCRSCKVPIHPNCMERYCNKF